jgi:hypothetical protein
MSLKGRSVQAAMGDWITIEESSREPIFMVTRI